MAQPLLSDGKRIVVKNGSKVVSIRLEPYQHLPTILELEKQRYHCKNCGDYWTAQTDLVQANSFISNHTRIKNTRLTKRKISMILILTKKVFPSAQLVIDRFHVVKHLNSAFNEFRVREMKRINQQNKKGDANKLKTNWKFLLKSSSKVDTTYYKTWRSFRSPKYPYLTEAMMIDRLLSLSIPLAEAYESFQLLGHHFRAKNPEGFFSLLKTYLVLWIHNLKRK